MRCWVACDHVSLRCGMHIAILAFDEGRACLLNHSIVVMNTHTASHISYAGFEIVIRDAFIFQLLPATTMQQEGVFQV